MRWALISPLFSVMMMLYSLSLIPLSHRSFRRIVGHLIILWLIFPGNLRAQEPFNAVSGVTFSLKVENFSDQTGKGTAVLHVQIPLGFIIYGPPQDGDLMQYPPQINWVGSQNVSMEDMRVIWPRPETLSLPEGNGSFYTRSVDIPIRFQAQKLGQAVVLQGMFSGMACQKLCVPFQGHFAVTLEKAIYKPLDVPVELKKNLIRIDAPPSSSGSMYTLFLQIFLAFLGGVILNFMPCVLPILGLKMVEFTQIASCSSYRHIRQHFLTLILGIYLFFFVLSGILGILQSLGRHVGWGMHFQNPYFLSFMIVTFTIFCANLWGLFEFPLPSWVVSLFHRRPLVAERFHALISGIMMAIFSTPCSAPFVGTAVGFALSESFGVLCLILLSLATGFSFPYWVMVLVAYKIPVPKPGAWMIGLKRVLAIILGGTVIWLLILLKAHSQGIGVLFTVAFLGIGSVGLCFARGLLVRMLSATSFILVLGIPLIFSSPLSDQDRLSYQEASLWKPFSLQELENCLKKDQTIFVDVTADWCLTCQVNKYRVLNQPRVIEILSQSGIVAMRADWTKNDPKITLFLKQFHRFGIPFYIVFGPKARYGLILSEVLTQKHVIEAIESVRERE